MNTRGAPAIAIAAALALAVELEQSKGALTTAALAAAFVVEKMDYLVTSRPTAVNLHEAAERLKAGGSLRITTLTQNEAQLTFRVDAHVDARTRFVVEYSKPSYEHVPLARLWFFVHSTSVEWWF